MYFAQYFAGTRGLAPNVIKPLILGDYRGSAAQLAASKVQVEAINADQKGRIVFFTIV